ncbi:protein O-linked-mannose beta-1,2-N-acetylglucosaminyltransferase 1-like isoform X2 [Dysidea avara]|uniref:protein O-linked-mannose beta-1,2-N-acetylglucosaminyltransferase 1-like isoform X2 n=1 Tax=Dysidea avara TaxID=196820 RepID=UPI003316F28B
MEGPKMNCNWRYRTITLFRYQWRSLPLFYIILILVVSLGCLVVVVSASCQHVAIFEANRFDCSREIILSCLTTVSFLVVLSLETSVQSGISEQWRVHINILELVWSGLMLVAWLVSSLVNTYECQQLYKVDPRLTDATHYSMVKESYLVLIITSYANSITWATLVYVHFRRSLQVRGSFKMYWKWLLMAMMCLMFGVNAYLMLHVGMQRNICTPPYQASANTLHHHIVAALHSGRLPSLSRNPHNTVQYTVNCSWSDFPQENRRTKFCSRYYWYSEFCRCNDPLEVDISPNPLIPNNVEDVPVAVIASNRTQCLARTLYHLLQADGANVSQVNVFLDGNFQEQIDVCELFGVSVTIHDIHYNYYLKNSYQITKHYKLSLTEMFKYYPEANAIIVLEDDLQVSPDFFSYFSQTVNLLHEDNSIYCISAWNDFGYKHSSKDPALLYRVDTMPGLGWMLKRSLYKEELEKKWPGKFEPLTWDGWMREPEQRKGRECIIPDVSRTFHFAPGTHIFPEQQKKYFETRSFNTLRRVSLKNVDRLTNEDYETFIHKLVSSAKLVDHNLTECSEGLIPNKTADYYVIYLHKNAAILVKLMECFQLWDIDVRGDHKNMWRFWYKENHILVVRCPLSPYCAHAITH